MSRNIPSFREQPEARSARVSVALAVCRATEERKTVEVKLAPAMLDNPHIYTRFMILIEAIAAEGFSTTDISRQLVD